MRRQRPARRGARAGPHARIAQSRPRLRKSRSLHPEPQSSRCSSLRASLAAQFGTPCFVYSRATLEGAWRAFDQAFGTQPHLVCYAVKANANLGVLDIFARLGSGFDIVSGGELARVVAAGGDARRVVFSGVGKTETEIEKALASDILCFNVESASELTVRSDSRLIS